MGVLVDVFVLVCVIDFVLVGVLVDVGVTALVDVCVIDFVLVGVLVFVLVLVYVGD